MNKKRHILFISSWYPNRNNITHGIFNRQFAEAAAIQNNISVLHVCSDEHLTNNFEITETEENNIKTVIVYYKKIKSTFPIFSLLSKRRQIIKAFEMGYAKIIVAATKPNLIQLNVVMPAGVGVYHLSQKYSIPYVINEGWTGYTPEDGNYKGWIQKYFTKKIIHKAKAILPVSEDLKNAMLSHELKGNYFIVPNVVDINFFTPSQFLSNTTINFIHISALDDVQKNVSGIIRAFCEAQKTLPHIRLNIVGEGKDKAKLQSLVLKLGVIDKIKFKGRLMSTQLVDEINANHCLIMFSNYETFCLAAVEALSCGKPVITSKAGGVTNQINNQLGISINSKDEEALSNAIINFANSSKKYDSKLIREFVVQNFSKEIISSKLNEVYTFALNNQINSRF